MKVKVYIRDENGKPELVSEGEFKDSVNRSDIIARINKDGFMKWSSDTYYPPHSIFKLIFEE